MPAPVRRRPSLVVATTNPGKLREYRELLGDLGTELRSLADFPPRPEVEEDGDTFEANAVKKATETARALGELVLADDSGLIIDALDGEPGVLSARYAMDEAADRSDAANIAKVLRRLAGVAREQRTARFVCVIALADPSGSVLTVEGSCEGRITVEPRGAGGFGYDPIFEDPHTRLTFAELSPAKKNEISHRSRALSKLRSTLSDFPNRKFQI